MAALDARSHHLAVNIFCIVFVNVARPAAAVGYFNSHEKKKNLVVCLIEIAQLYCLICDANKMPYRLQLTVAWTLGGATKSFISQSVTYTCRAIRQ